ncbi:MAG: hypothetical protein IJB32_00575 [Clostridia bacterium]|nr:hypothetical protein [Clostridia bacterium]
MKKFFAVFLPILILFSLCLTACEQPENESNEPCEHSWVDFVDKNSKICSLCGAFDGIEITKQDWDRALGEEIFENVTLNFTFVAEEIVDSSGGFVDVLEGAKTVQVIKFADGKCYRKVEKYDNNGIYQYDEVFEVTGTQANGQRKMFYDMYATLLKDYDNFVYDSVKSIYTTPNEIIVDVSKSVGEMSTKVYVSIKNAQVKFGANGKLEYFEAHHTESIYENDTLLASISGKIIWTYSNYGTTVIE